MPSQITRARMTHSGRSEKDPDAHKKARGFCSYPGQYRTTSRCFRGWARQYFTFRLLCCHGDNPNQDDSLWQLHGPTSFAAEARRASSGHLQQLRTDLTLRPLVRCVEGLLLCGISGVERRANQCPAGADHAFNHSSVEQMNVSTPSETSVRSQHR